MTRNILIAFIITWMWLGFVPKTNSVFAKGTSKNNVAALYGAAQKDFSLNQYKSALQKLNALISKFPQYEPAKILLAKSLYRTERFNDAHTVFARLNLESLDAETSYEYGFSFYSADQFDPALKAFKRVPSSNALYDLAQYYGAVSAIKLRRIKEAEEMIEKAVVLPDKLSKSRVLLVKHIEAMRLMEEQKDLKNQRTAVQKENATDQQKTQQKTQQNEILKKPQVVPVVVFKDPFPKRSTYLAPEFDNRYLGVMDDDKLERYAKLEFSTIDTVQDFRGNSTDTYRAQKGAFKFAAGPSFFLPKKFNGKEMVLGSQFYLGYEDQNAKGRRERIVVSEDTDNVPRLEQDPTQTVHSKIGSAGFTGWFEVPLPNSFYMGTSAQYFSLFPDLETGQRVGRLDYSLFSGFREYPHTARVKFTYENVLDNNNRASGSVLITEIFYRYNLPFKMSIEPGATVKYFNYLSEMVNGPDSSAAITAKISQSLPLGFALGTFGSYENQLSYSQYKINQTEQATADGIVTTGEIYLIAEPTAWIYGKIDQTLSQTRWTAKDPEKQSLVDKNISDYFSRLTMTAGINLIF